LLQEVVDEDLDNMLARELAAARAGGASPPGSGGSSASTTYPSLESFVAGVMADMGKEGGGNASSSAGGLNRNGGAVQVETG
jgi:hypothetical protein